jgi:hypothetical protein
MTSPALADDLAQELAAARLVYDEIARLKARATALRTVEDARIAYDALLERETREIAAVTRDRDALAARQRLRRARFTSEEPVAPPPPRPDRRPVVATRLDEVAPEPAARRQTADRRTLKKLVSRWQVAWSLDADLVAQVNSIADDAERPLGEALALLDWRLYATPIPGESESAHLTRVRDWHDVLATFADHLRADIATTETRSQNLLAIWERWSNAQASDAGRAEWDSFIAKIRAQKASELAALTAEVAAMRAAPQT